MDDTAKLVTITDRLESEINDNLVSEPAPNFTLNQQHSRRRTKSILYNLGVGAIIPVLTLVLWQVAGYLGWISDEFLPTPISIASTFANLIGSGELLRHLEISMGRAMLGFVIGGALGLLCGILTGLFRKLEYIFDPSIQVLRLVPHLAIAPLIILWFGFSETSKVVIILSGSFFPMYVQAFMGVRQLDPKLFEVGSVLGFGAFDRLRRLILPAALPNILLGLRLSLAVAWIGLVVAEVIGSQSGIGFLINEAKQNSNTEVIFVGIVVFAIVGVVIDFLYRFIEHRCLAWRESYKG
ncbi:sulfonate transport system permease protein [Paenibacillus shirakamiensis]|uniref:Sulfonate transport system permease protein n=1 Tax=Paenibacillus shirakamiensis TaxID=1265935 RepID=A0ABS4JIB2_9BACL|nr:ABC transporter permease [Paenibacillus shirakamiensis]MBP2000294.1 sulfonate transport system permease protein [Paenibacillus shirakamiensis]